MITALVLPALNRVLRSNAWALDKLRAHAGKSARIDCGPALVRIAIAATGELELPAADAAPEVTVRLLPGAALQLATRDPHAWSEVTVDGDTQFAATLHQVWQQIDWGVEEDLSQIFGDVAAHRLVSTVQAAGSAVSAAAGSLLRNVFEFWAEERPVVAQRRDVEAYNTEVDALRDDVARLEKRVEALRRARSMPEYGRNNNA